MTDLPSVESPSFLTRVVLKVLQNKPTWMRVAVVTAFCLALALLLAARTTLFTPASPIWAGPYDHHKYIYMAEHPLGTFHITPPCWRIAVPFLVQLMPLPTLTGFHVQAFAFVVITSVLFYFFLQKAGYTPVEGILGIVMLYSYGPATKNFMAGPYSPDPGSYAVSMIALIFILTGQDVLLAVTLALGATVKETTVLVIPLIYSIRAQKFVDIRLLLRTALIGLPAIAVLFALRGWIPAYNDVASYVQQMGPQLTEVEFGTAHYTYGAALHRVMAYHLSQTAINNLRDLTFGSVGLLWVLPFFALFSSGKAAPAPSGKTSLADSSNLVLLVRFLPFLGLTYFGWFVAMNADRRFAYAFPFWIMMGINALRSLAQGWNIDISSFIPVFLFQFLLNLLQPITLIVPFDLAAATFLISLGIVYSFRSRRILARQSI